MISGTHTHGTPGGFMMHLLYDMSTFGFVPETYRALVFGIFNVSHISINFYFFYHSLFCFISIVISLLNRVLLEHMRIYKMDEYLLTQLKF